MTPNEIRAKMKALQAERHNLSEKIIKAARSVVPVLLDAGRVNSAKELQELLFQHDVNEQAMLEFVKENPKGVLDAMLREIRDRDEP